MGKLLFGLEKPEPTVLVNYRFRKTLKNNLQKIAKTEGFQESQVVRHFLEEKVKEYFEYDQTKEVENG